jgi:Helix-turn-helix domain
MATAARYFDLVREMKDAYNHRLRLAESAKRIGIKPTARLFTTTVLTVRRWLSRFQQRGPSGLVALSRARHHQAQKLLRSPRRNWWSYAKLFPPSVRAV